MLIPRLQKRKQELEESYAYWFDDAPELPFEYAALWFYGLEPYKYEPQSRFEKQSRSQPQHKKRILPSLKGYMNDDPSFAHPDRYQKNYWEYPRIIPSKIKVEELMNYYKTLGGYGEWNPVFHEGIYEVGKTSFVHAWRDLIEERRERLSAKRFKELCQWADQVDYGTITEEEYAEQNVPQKADSVTDLAVTAVSWVVQKVALVLLMALFIFVIFGGLGGILG